MTTKDVETIINKGSWLAVGAPEDESRLVVEPQSEVEAKSRIRKEWNAIQRITVPELLRTLKNDAAS
ncbi:hypothetical protein Z517_10676 [Fonsecaea pedrosoi CBS 271.37]|uniref:Uncharacterized protein n=1 Tax=Fonsecaea pedrosoi CBS 271.37 TaxID=1442368 RepID=A0A0D2DE44_9EURO|nr:uncharacterized protein Z517_10676 [Fonsecaea pedrosoi CBS 271.37]KIW75931.1 hypothetical protein Z517_10676 [Fonsecaea pedrosoi CBS 271.37]